MEDWTTVSVQFYCKRKKALLVQLKSEGCRHGDVRSRLLTYCKIRLQHAQWCCRCVNDKNTGSIQSQYRTSDETLAKRKETETRQGQRQTETRYNSTTTRLRFDNEERKKGCRVGKSEKRQGWYGSLRRGTTDLRNNNIKPEAYLRGQIGGRTFTEQSRCA